MFEFDLGQHVVIVVSGESGEVIGRAQYSCGENMYQLRYKCADGRAVESWWAQSAISK